MSDIRFARTIVAWGIGETAATNDCDNYGMTFGCNPECPILIAGECELSGGKLHI